MNTSKLIAVVCLILAATIAFRWASAYFGHVNITIEPATKVNSGPNIPIRKSEGRAKNEAVLSSSPDKSQAPNCKQLIGNKCFNFSGSKE